jgi:hypothetical protein
MCKEEGTKLENPYSNFLFSWNLGRTVKIIHKISNKTPKDLQGPHQHTKKGFQEWGKKPGFQIA